MPRLTISRSELMTALVGLAAAVFPAAAMAQTPVTPSAETHTVKPGDTLWGIARQYLGDPFLWPEIYRLNTNVVEDPHWIYPGEVLQLHGGAEVSAVPAAPAESAAVVAAAPVPAAAEVAAAPAEVAGRRRSSRGRSRGHAGFRGGRFDAGRLRTGWRRIPASGLFPKAGVEISSPPLLNEVEAELRPAAARRVLCRRVPHRGRGDALWRDARPNHSEGHRRLLQPPDGQLHQHDGGRHALRRARRTRSVTR